MSGTVERPCVLLVAASPRSGTTLLGCLLDLHPCVFFAGELNRRRTWLGGGGTCACGATYAACECWSAVLTRPSFADDPAVGDRWSTAADIDRLAARVRQPAMALRALWGRPTAEQRRYVSYLDELYRDLAADRGATVIVDTSKLNLVDLVLLRRFSTLAIRIVHLHREPRGVVFSRLSGARRHAGRDAAHHAAAVRLGWPIVVSDALRWDWANGVLVLLRRRLGTMATLGYEQLVADSQGATRALLAQVGLDPDGLADAWEAPEVVALGQNHSIRGNRVRSRRGPTRIELDERWRVDLSGCLALFVRLATAPVRGALARS